MPTTRFRLTPPQIQLSESEVARACVELLRYRGWWVVRQHAGRFKTPDDRWLNIGARGLPDYAVMKAPSFLMEVKRPGPGGKLSDHQRAMIEAIEGTYGLSTIVVSSVEELAAWLEQHEAKVRQTPCKK